MKKRKPSRKNVYEATYDVKIKGLKDEMCMFAVSFKAPNLERAFDIAKRAKSIFNSNCRVGIENVTSCEQDEPRRDEPPKTGRIGF